MNGFYKGYIKRNTIADYIKIAFSESDKYGITCKIKINGVIFNCMIDTGVRNFLMMSDASIDKIKKQNKNNKRIDFDYGSIEFDLDDDQLMSFSGTVFDYVSDKIDMVIGFPIFHNKCFFDFKNRCIHIGYAYVDNLLSRTPVLSEIPATITHKEVIVYPYIKANSFAYKMCFDTGSQHTFTYRKELIPDKINLFRKIKVVFSNKEIIDMELYKNIDMRMNDIMFENQIFGSVDCKIENNIRWKNYDGVLGRDIISKMNFVVDSENECIKVLSGKVKKKENYVTQGRGYESRPPFDCPPGKTWQWISKVGWILTPVSTLPEFSSTKGEQPDGSPPFPAPTGKIWQWYPRIGWGLVPKSG